MDDREQADTNVVNLRRKDDPDATKREHLAKTIYAPVDDAGTFSHGNLIVPDAKPDEADRSDSHGDPFFDRRLKHPGSDPARETTEADAGDGTDAYFARITSRTAAEMAVSAPTAGPTRSLLGSADMPSELPKRRGRFRKRAAALASLAVVAVAAVTVAVAAGTRGGRGQLVRHPMTAGATVLAADVSKAFHAVAHIQTNAAAFWHVRKAAAHFRLPRIRRHAAASPTPPSNNSVSVSSGTGAVSVTSTTSPSTTSPVTSYASSSSASTSSATPSSSGSGSTHPPAFGAEGVLGPGSSPNG